MQYEGTPVLVYTIDSEETHLAYPTAIRSLCLLVIERGVRGLGADSTAKCICCRETLARIHTILGREGDHGFCFWKTSRGLPCQRPAQRDGVCPSHRHLAKAAGMLD